MHFLTTASTLLLATTTATALPSLTKRADGTAPNDTYTVQINIVQNDIHHTDKPDVTLTCPLNSLCYREDLVVGYPGINLVNGSGTNLVDTDFVECRLFLTYSGFQDPPNNPYGSDVFGYEPKFGDTNEYPFPGAICYMAGGFKEKAPYTPTPTPSA